MNWLLVAIVMGTPIRTDLIFPSLSKCLTAEEEMREQWATRFNAALASKASKESIDFVKGQMTYGTCIPAK